jgi:flagellar hook-associated protein 1 FlgK
MDQRDLLIDQVAGLANVQVQDEGDGTISIWLGGQILVYRDTAQQLILREKSGESASLHEVAWANSNTLVNFQSGEIAGLLLVRDEAIPELHSGLDEFAVALVQNVNSLHQTGYSLTGQSGLDFFDPNTTGIHNIALSAEILQDDNNIAASGDGSAGDGSMALALFNLQNSLVMDDGTATLNQYYASLSADLGSLSQAAESEVMESEVSLQQLENWRTSAEGVSLDEEMANMVKFQQSYAAMANFMGTVDEMLTVLLTIA